MLAEVLPWAPDGWIWVYFIPSSSVLYVDPDPGRWFVAESLRRSWWDLQQKGWLQSHCHQKWGKTITPSTPPSQSCTCICLHRANRDSRLLNKPALWEVWADCKTHHTNATVTVHPEWRTIALPWCAVCPMNTTSGAMAPSIGKSQVQGKHCLCPITLSSMWAPQSCSQSSYFCSSCSLSSVA